MTNELLTANNAASHDITGLDVVKSVNEFYSTAFDHILWLLGTLILLLGIAVPLAFYFFQKRQLALKEKALADQLKNQFAALTSSLRKENEDFLAAEKLALQQGLAKLGKEIEIKTNETAAVIYALQGNIFLERNNCQNAFQFLCKSLDYCVKTESPINVQGALRFLTSNLLPKMFKNDFGDEKVVTAFKKTIEAAAKMEANGLLNVDINQINEAFAKAQKRESAPAK